MRILEVVHGFPPAAQGGTELYARAHAAALRAHTSDDVLVLTREQDPDRDEYAVRIDEHAGLRVVWINNTFRNLREFEDTYSNGAIDAVAGSVIDQFQPHVAHIHHLTGLSTGIVGLLAKRRVPCVLTLHDYWLICHRGQLLDVHQRVCDGPEPGGCGSCLGRAGSAGTAGFIGARAVRFLERRLPPAPAREVRRLAESVAAVAYDDHASDDQVRRRVAHMREVCAQITHFLAPSRHIRDRFVRFGVSPECITVVQNGVEFSGACNSRVAASRTMGASPLRLGFFGTLMISKAPHLLLEAARRLPRGSVSVDLFGAYSAYHGDDSYRERLEPFLRDPGANVHGAIPHEQVAQALRSIDVLAVPSIWPENSPLVIQEAFLAGVPVVASRIGGIPEVVIDGRNGLLFQPGDAGDLSKALARLIADPGLLGTLQAGIPAVRSIEEDVRSVRDLYEALDVRPTRVRKTKKKRLAAIVLNYRTPLETLLAVKSLLASRRPIDELIVVNNDSADETRQALNDVWASITYVHARTNLGFSGGMNAGIRLALGGGAERILLVNSDVIVPPDTVERLEQVLDRDSRAGIAGPMVLARAEPDRIASLGMAYSTATGRMRHRGHGASAPAATCATEVVDGVSGCLMMITREVFEAVGLLDEDYFFSFEDLDFCLQARRAGFRTILAGCATAYHEGGQSLGSRSPRRFYYAARNHLLLTRRGGRPAGRLRMAYQFCCVVALNLAHAIVSPGGSLLARLAEVTRGTYDYVTGRFGSGL